MAKFLDTQAISSELMNLIKNAKEKIILVSPYLQVNSQIQERLNTKSKIGTLSEIVIVYGKSELKKTELQWIKEIQDLKLFEKHNLHAKCYLNEEVAIICSMNLYEFSQQHNIEMGILITKKDDQEAYQALIEEIDNIKLQGIRNKFESLSVVEDSSKDTNTSNSQDKTTSSHQPKSKPYEQTSKPIELTPCQKLQVQILRDWRLNESKVNRTTLFSILTDDEIKAVATAQRINYNKLFTLLSQSIVKKYGEHILNVINYSSGFTFGKVTSIQYQNYSNSYNKVKFKIHDSNEEIWLDTTYELPKKDTLLAVSINRNWFNEYIYLDN